MAAEVTGAAPAGAVERPAVLLLPSPLLGPSVWQPVAELLRLRGWEATVAVSAGTSPAEVLDAWEEALPDRPAVLVPHSNAGLYVPAIAAVFPLAGTVFVDAALAPEAGDAPLAPPRLLDRLRELAGPDDVLPPWTRWWPQDDLETLLPDDEVRERVDAEARRLPLSYFEATVPAAAGWASGRNAYLAFGATYAEELDRARAAGWPTDELDGGHLHMLVDPDAVTTAIVGLLSRI